MGESETGPLHSRKGRPITSTKDHGNGALELLARLRRGLAGGGEARPGQDEMTCAVATCIEDDDVLVVQAPTGVGKSLAYLSAAIASGRTVVIATSSIALQDQLWNKDLPYVSTQLPERELKVALLKGRSNYLCRAALAEALVGGDRREPTRGQRLELGTEDELVTRDEIIRLQSWAETTETGDRADLSFEPTPQSWSAVSTSSEECPGRLACPHGHNCFAEKARADAERADIVIVNTHLYALHIASDGAILPGHDVVVFDEAHETETVFSSVLGVELSPTQILALARGARRVIDDDAAITALVRAAQDLEEALEVIGRPRGPDARPDDVRLIEGARSDERLAVALDALERAVIAVQRDLDAIPANVPETTRTRARRVELGAAALVRRLHALSVSSDEHVVWVAGARSLRSAPLEVGKMLEPWFWQGIRGGAIVTEELDDEEVAQPPKAVVLTSATIPSTLGTRLHVPRPRELSVESPFDFKEQALLYVPHVPDPRRDPEGWRRAAQEELVELITAAGGRTLALFTSNAAMNDAALAVRSRVPHPILVQGDKPRHALLSEFVASEHTCLFATRSFFQGVDVPGASLSVVALDRIPFPRPGDPLIDAWQDLAGGGFGGFSAVAIPIAATVLAQAAGRLIRTRSDKGVVAVLDSRLADATYRAQLLAALPPMHRTRSRDAVVAFLASALESSTG
jgi:ATP-dependent DNA helicase DinG